MISKNRRKLKRQDNFNIVKALIKKETKISKGHLNNVKIYSTTNKAKKINKRKMSKSSPIRRIKLIRQLKLTKKGIKIH